MSGSPIMDDFLGGVKRYDETKDLAVLDRAIAAGRTVVRSERDIESWRLFTTVLGQALSSRYLVTREPAYLAESVDALRAVAQELPPGHRLSGNVYRETATMLRELSDVEGRLELADEAIYWFHRCAEISPEFRTQAYFGLSMAFQVKAKRLDDIPSHQAAVDAARQAVDVAMEPRERGKRMLLLAAMLRNLHRKTENPAFIDEAVAVARDGNRLFPAAEGQRRDRDMFLSQLQAQRQMGGWQ
jgi:hypothetical protein